MDTRMYVMTHKKIEEMGDELYIPLHVGKANGQNLGYVGDDTGDHISEKNASYCELTGIYWIWKNVKCDVVGICHYRRFFVNEHEKPLKKAEIEAILEKKDMIVSSSLHVENVYEQYCSRHVGKDLDMCRVVLKEKYPEYIPAFDYTMKIGLVTIGNMWITRKHIFDRYCEWLFDILFEVEKRIDISGYDTYQKRVMGFLAERLFRVWLFMQPETMLEGTVRIMEASVFQTDEKNFELLFRYAKIILEPVLQLYQLNQGGMLVTPFECGDNFEGKIPVWVCWWKGEADMPEVVRHCIQSIKKNLISDKMTFRMITLENCMQYVTFTDDIIRKFNDGTISMEHLSDILKAELLYRYGGLWVDAACYVPEKISLDNFEYNELYTLKFKNSVYGPDRKWGNLPGDVWYARRKGHKLFQFLTESLWYYWEVEKTLVDKKFIDFIVLLAIDEFADIRRELEVCPYSPEAVYKLQTYINSKCTLQRLEKLKTESVFYKLNCQEKFLKENMAGLQTVYGYLTADGSV